MTPQFNDRFVLLPSYNNFSKIGLHYKDLLTYISIRSFNNGQIDLCIPSLDTISKRSGMNKRTTMQSIIRLQRSGFLKVKKSNKKKVSNEYEFIKCNVFCQIPYTIFDAEDLSYSQKAMLIALRQLFDSVNLKSYNNLSDMAFMLGLTYKTVYTQYKSLVKNGYIEEETITKVSGQKKKIITLSSKINWKYLRTEIKSAVPVDNQPDVFQVR